MKKIEIATNIKKDILTDHSNGINLNALVTKYNLGRKIIKKFLLESNVTIINKSEILEKQLGLNAILLKDMYEVQKLSIDIIALKLNTNSQVIKTAFKRYKIKTRNTAEQKKLDFLAKYPDLLNEAKLRQWYSIELKSPDKIAEIIGCSSSPVEDALERFNIPKIDPSLRNIRTEKDELISRIGRNLRSRLSNAVSNNQKMGSAVNDLGCSIEALKDYLATKFYKDNASNTEMTWDNYGQWHIDHDDAIANYDLTNREELLKACHYTNLLPKWAGDNQTKSNKIIGEKPKRVKMFIITGVAGSGKSWVCDQLIGVNYVSFDTIDKTMHYHYIVELSKNGCPIVYDPFRKVKQTYHIYAPLLDTYVIKIEETEDIILERLKSRGSKCTIEKVREAIKHNNRYKNLASFTGTSVEVLRYLQEQLALNPPNHL